MTLLDVPTIDSDTIFVVKLFQGKRNLPEKFLVEVNNICAVCRCCTSGRIQKLPLEVSVTLMEFFGQTLMHQHYLLKMANIICNYHKTNQRI